MNHLLWISVEMLIQTWCLELLFILNRGVAYFQYISYLVMPFRIRMLQVHQILKTRSFNFDKIALRKIVNLFEFASFINFFYSCNYLLACACLHYIWMTEYAFFNLVNVWFKNNENFDNGGFAISREVLSKHINIAYNPSSIILLLFILSFSIIYIERYYSLQSLYDSQKASIF